MEIKIENLIGTLVIVPTDGKEAAETVAQTIAAALDKVAKAALAASRSESESPR